MDGDSLMGRTGRRLPFRRKTIVGALFLGKKR
jgi:hypothetical protein